MSIKDWKNKEVTTLLSEAWGFKFNTLQEFDEFNGSGEVQEEAAEEVVETVEEDINGVNEGEGCGDEELEERASMSDASPKGGGRKVTKPNGERVTSENTAVSAELQKAILEVLRKHF